MPLGLPESQDPLIALAAAAIAAVLTFCLWWWSRARGRLIEDLPTTSAAGVVLGLNEVVGRVECDHPVAAPMSGLPCVWWKNEFYITDSDGKTKKGRATTGGPGIFRLADASGAVHVMTKGADLDGIEVYDGPTRLSGDASLVERYMSGQSKRQVTEWVVPVDTEVYVLGAARLPLDSLTPVIGRDQSGRHPMIVSAKGEEALVSSHKAVANVAWLASLVASVVWAMAWVNGDDIVARGALDLGSLRWWPAIVAVWFWGLLMVLASTAFLYNGLVTLRNRAEKAWSLIDVELRRRHDLIPELARTVSAFAAYEAKVQAEMTTLRSGGNLASSPSDTAVDEAEELVGAESAALRSIFARAEAYPELQAAAAFSQLREELTETEDRIARARSFYNESVKVLRDRAQTFPSKPVAWMFELELQREFAAAPPGAAHPPQTMPSPRPAATRIPKPA